MNTLHKILVRLIEGVVFIMFLIMVVVAFSQVVMRYIFDQSLAWGGEVPQYGMVWMCFLGAALVTLDRGHTRVDFFMNLLPKSLFPYISVIINFLTGVFMAFLCYSSIPIIKTSMTTLTPALGIPYGYVSLALPIGAALMILFLIVDSIRWIRERNEEEI